MEAASAATGLPERLRARRLEREFARLRPLGEAYLLRRFNGQIGRADAEDAVAEVLARLHRRIEQGHVPHNLRATFLTAARNAAIDLLRSRRLRPTAPLEAAAAAPDTGPLPCERAEGRESAQRLQEALARMRDNYSEAIVLRFGLGLTVPEIAAHFQISLPAAKKLVLRATRQARKQLIAIEGAEFCPEMRQLASRALPERELVGLAGEAEAELLRAHFAHCGGCRSHLLALREGMQELGAAGALALAGGERLGRLGGFEAAGQWLGAATGGLEAAAEKARQLALRAAGALPSGEGAAGALVGTGQKVIAICGTATAATATCLISGAVGPGIGVSAAPPEREGAQRPAALRSAPTAPAQSEPPSAAPVALPAPSAPPPPQPAPEPQPAPPPPAPAPAPSPHAEAPPPSEFGLEGGGSDSPSAPSAPPPSSGGEGGGDFGAAGTAPPPPRRGGAASGLGFQG